MHVEFCLDICHSEVYGESGPNMVMGLFSNKHTFALLKLTTHTSLSSDSIPVQLSYFLPPQHFPEDPSEFLVPQAINEGIQ